MAEKRPLCIYSGTIQELSGDDTVEGYAPIMTAYTLLGRNTDTTGVPQVIARHDVRKLIYAMQACNHQLVSNASIAIDWDNGATQRVTLTQVGHTMTFAHPYEGQVYRLKLTQGTGGSKTVTTWPIGIKWAGGAPPALTTTAGKHDIVTLLYDDGEYSADINKNF